MKKFSRCILILLLVTVLSGVIGYAVLNNGIHDMYISKTQLYIVPGEKAESAVRTSAGSLNDDFRLVIHSSYVISDAQKTAGTSENIASYITVNAPANSNIIEIICTNPDQNTAKAYVDAVAKSTLKVTSIIPVEKISILTEGTASGTVVKPNLYRYTAYITGIGFAVCLLVELLVLLFLAAFKRAEEDDEADYNRIFKEGAHVTPGVSYIQGAAVQQRDPSVVQKEKEQDYAVVRQKHPIEPDILEDEEDDDSYGEYDMVHEDEVEEEDNVITAEPVIENEVAVTQEESSAEVLGRIPG